MRAKLLHGRGTSSYIAEIKPANWAGKSFVEYDREKMDGLEGDFLFTSKRGTASLSKEAYPKSRRIIPEGGFSVVVGRGTGIKHL